MRANLPTVYLLDGESRFQTLVDIVETMHAQVMIVAIGNEALRARDYVPANTCTQGGGGQAAFLQFIGTELVPFVERTFPSDPQRRILLGTRTAAASCSMRSSTRFLPAACSPPTWRATRRSTA
jgi:predicted alpha/beta superfamily hydrolase